MSSKEQPPSTFSVPIARYPTPSPSHGMSRMGFGPGVAHTPLTPYSVAASPSTPAYSRASTPVPSSRAPTPAVLHPSSVIVRKGSVNNVATVSTPIHYDRSSKPSIRTNDDDDWFDGQSDDKKKEPLMGYCFKEQKMSPFAPGYQIQNYGKKKFALGLCHADNTRMSIILPN